MADDNPVGKTFKLKNDLGLEAIVTIKEDRRNRNRNGMDFDEQVFSSDGCTAAVFAEFLEGYTAKERTGNPEILVRHQNKGDRICWLAFWRDSSDEKAFSDYPLWQNYFDWGSKKAFKQKQLLASFFNEFKKEKQSLNMDA